MVLPHIGGFFDAVMVSLAAALISLLSFIPALIGAVIILVIGWILSGWVAKLVTMLLGKVGFDMAAQRTGVSDFVARTGMGDPRPSRVLGELVKWFIRLIFLEAAAQAVHLDAVTNIINQLILFIPNLIVALIILMVGFMLARFVAGFVRGATSEAGFQSPNLLAKVAQYAIVAFAIVVAVNQIGIASTIVNTLFMAVVGALALALGLSFGLGGREVAGQIWQQTYEKTREATPQIEKAAQAAAERAQQPQTATRTAPAATPAPQSQTTPQPARRRYEVE